MTKREASVFKKYYDEAIDAYMEYVRKHENAPIDVLERACVFTELNKLLFSNNNSE